MEEIKEGTPEQQAETRTSEIAELREMLKKVQETVQELSTDFLVKVYEQGVNAGDQGQDSERDQERSDKAQDTAALQKELKTLKRQLVEKDLKERVYTLATKYDLNGPVFYSYLKGSQDCTHDPATGSFSVMGDDHRSLPLETYVERFASTEAGRQLTLPKPPPSTGLSQTRESAPETLTRRDILAKLVPDKLY